MGLGFSALTLILFPAHAVQAEPKTYTLNEALSTAVEHSPVLQKSQASLDEMRWKNTEGASVFLPSLQLTANHFFERKYQLLDVSIGGGPVIEIPQIFPSSSATLAANWLLFDGFGNVNTYRATRDLKNAAQADYEWTEFQLAQDVKLQYARVVSAKKLKEVAEQNLKTLENHQAQVNLMKKGGISTNYDVLRVESQLSEAQADLLQAQDNIIIAQEKLAQILGVSEAVDVASDADLETPNSAPIKPIEYTRDDSKRKDLIALESKVTAADEMDSVSSTFWIPKVGLGAQYNYYNNLSDPLTDYSNYRRSWSAGFFLTWDIFNPRSYALSKEEKYKSIQVQKNLMQAHLQAPVDFAFWKKRYLYNSTLYEAKKVDQSRATETVRLAQAGFKAGIRTTTDVLDAELDLFRARAGIVNAQMNCLEAKVKLELSQGQTL